MTIAKFKTQIKKMEKELKEKVKPDVLAILSFTDYESEEERERAIEAKLKEMEEAGCSGPLIILLGADEAKIRMMNDQR